MLRSCALLLVSLSALRADAGVEVLTPRFRVITEMPAETALQAADELERAHASLKAFGVSAPVSGEPIHVLLVANQEQLEASFPPALAAPGIARGFFRPGADRDYVVLSWEPAETARIALAHEYVHWIYRDQSKPLWFREGLAEYLSRSIPVSNGTFFGAPVPVFLQKLRSEEWIPLTRLLAAKREAEMVTRPTFYAQCWLLVHWHASKGDAAEVWRYEELEKRLANTDPEEMESKLRKHVESLVSQPPPATSVSFPPLDTAAFPVRRLDEWEWTYHVGDVWREAQSWEGAEDQLRRLEGDYPDRPEPSEILGALLMDRYDYAAAEETLARAVAKGSKNPRAHHRYALMLLRPVEGGADTQRQRAALARDHARIALDRRPEESDYLLTEAQALGVLGEWSAAADRLTRLAATPEWRERAVEEFDVLMLRRRGYVAGLPRPSIDPVAASLDLAFLRPEPGPVAQPPPPPEEPTVWPPPGTVLVYGHIVSVDCGARDKVVTFRTPRWRMRLRERADSPAELHSPPKGWRKLPCDAKGLEVNVAYKPILKDSDVRGELVAVVF